MIQGFVGHATSLCRRVLAAALFTAWSVIVISGWPATVLADVFTVDNVPVDARAQSAAAAREQAIAGGQQRALERLFDRLVPDEAQGQLPRPSAYEISDLVRDFAVEGERASAVRYLATLSVRFRADDIRAMLRTRDIPFAETMSKPVVVLPISRSGAGTLLWEEENQWRQAWSQLRADGLVPFVVPVGDLDDVTAIDAKRAAAGDRKAIDAIMGRYGAGSVLVAIAEQKGPQGSTALQISTARYQAGIGTAESRTQNVPPELAPDGLWDHAASAVATDIENAWKQANLIRAGSERSLIATVYISQLGDLIDVRKRLTGVSLLSSYDMLYLARDAAQLRLHYFGDERQLATALAQSDLTLEQAAVDWVLRRSGGAQKARDTMITPQAPPEP